MLLVLFLVIACTSEDPKPTSSVSLALPPTPTAQPEPTLTQTATATVMASPTPTQRPSPGSTAIPTSLPTPSPTAIRTAAPTLPPLTATPTPFPDFSGHIGPGTIWGEIAADLNPQEQSCIEEVEYGLDQPILGGGVYANDYDVKMFACLGQGTARAILLAAMIAGFEEADGRKISATEISCIKDRMVQWNAADVVAGMAGETADRLPAGEFFSGFLRCAHEWLAHLLAGSLYDEGNEVTQDATECVRDILHAMDAELALELMEGGGSREAVELEEGLYECVSLDDLGGPPESRLDIPDDHSDKIAGSTEIDLGQPVSARTDYEGDIDYFVFEAKEGALYRVHASPEYAEDLWVELYGPYPNFDFLDAFSFSGGGADNGILWQSPFAGKVHIGVFGRESDGYKLQVTAVEVTDDHGDVRSNSSGLDIGGPGTFGNLDYKGDLDVFRFEGTEGMVYRVVASLETLGDSIITVEDSGGQVVAFNDDSPEYGFAAQVTWKASGSQFYYVYVTGYGTGSYRLETSEWEDEHGDSRENATKLQFGIWTYSSIDTEDDRDYFTFDAEQNVEYLIEFDLRWMEKGVVMLLDEEGEHVYTDIDFVGDIGRIFWQAPDSGPYWILVTGRSDESTDYGVVVWAGSPSGEDDDSSETPLPGKWELVSGPFNFPMSWAVVSPYLPMLEAILRTKAVEHSAYRDVYLTVQCWLEPHGPGSDSKLLVTAVESFDNPIEAHEADAWNLDEVAVLVNLDGWEKPKIQTWSKGNSEQFDPWLLERSMYPWGDGERLSMARDLVANDARFLELTVMGEKDLMGKRKSRTIKFDTTGAQEILGHFVNACVGE